MEGAFGAPTWYSPIQSVGGRPDGAVQVTWDAPLDATVIGDGARE
jgi:hypothetical protein